jgi:uncharacterized protein (DUF1810 family)
MWFVFAQVAGLGPSGISQRYAIHSPVEARAYPAHPVLGASLRECGSLLAIGGPSAGEILGPIDVLKLRSSMTLFERADPAEPLFREVLERYHGGVANPARDVLVGCGDALGLRPGLSPGLGSGLWLTPALGRGDGPGLGGWLGLGSGLGLGLGLGLGCGGGSRSIRRQRGRSAYTARIGRSISQ